MPYDNLSAKQQRTVERDVESLFSVKALVKDPLEENLKDLFLHRPRVRVNGREIFLSPRAVAALDRLTDLLWDRQRFHAISWMEVFNISTNIFEACLEKELQPCGKEFEEQLTASIASQVKDYRFAVTIGGLDIADQKFLQLGTYRIERSDTSKLENLKFQIALDRFKEGLWLVGAVGGSEVVAKEKFLHGTSLIVGVIGICGALLYKGAIWRSHVAVSFIEQEDLAVMRWDIEGSNPVFSVKFRGESLELTSESIKYLTDQCFLQELCSILDRRNPSELEEAICRSVFWFAEAYGDRNATMQFVKLWSCIECFFSIDKTEITEFNARGLASVLVFGGYQVVSTDDYPSFKRRVKALYDLRSKALHRAEFGHIDTEDLDDLSHWVAWLIVSMVSLAQRGYRTLDEIKVQAARLDVLSLIRERSTCTPSVVPSQS